MSTGARKAIELIHGFLLGTLLAAAILNLLALGAGAQLFYYQGF